MHAMWISHIDGVTQRARVSRTRRRCLRIFSRVGREDTLLGYGTARRFPKAGDSPPAQPGVPPAVAARRVEDVCAKIAHSHVGNPHRLRQVCEVPAHDMMIKVLAVQRMTR